MSASSRLDIMRGAGKIKVDKLYIVPVMLELAF